MSKLKRLITLGLSSLLVLSISMTSLASGLGGNTNSGGSEGIGDDPAYAHKFMAYPENQGYRISIVDRQGNRVTNSVDIVNYIPTDIDSIGGDNSTHGASVYKTGYQKYKSYIGWKDYSDLGLNKSNSYYFSNGIKTEEYKGTTWNKKGVPVNVTAKGNIGTNMYPKVAFEIFLSDVYNTEVKKKVAAGEQGLKEVTPEDVKIPLPSVLNADKTAFYPGGVELITLMKSTVGHMGEDINSTDNILTLMVNSKMPIYNHIGKNTEKTDYLFRFVDPADSSRIGKKEIDKETGEEKITTNAGIITEKGYKVIIEPVYWFVPEILSIHPEALERNNNSPHFGWITAVCYGTVSYLAKYAEHIAPDLFGIDVGTEKANELNSLTWVGPDWGTANLGTTTLMLEETDEELKIKEPSAANPPMEHISNSFNYLSIQTLASGDRYKSVGYAVHIYDNLLGNTGTSTFDEVNYGPSSPNGYKPGPSEDKSTEGGKEQQNNIIKYYSRKAGDTYTYIDNTIRKETISPIEIEDEIGYSVDSWFTSPTLKEPTSKSDSYTDVKNSIPNTQNCSDTGTVTLEKGQSLYVRLVKTPAVVKVYTTGENVKVKPLAFH